MLVSACASPAPESDPFPDMERCDAERTSVLAVRFRDDWREELVVALPEGLERISVGGLVEDANFANRGDILVSYTGTAGEMRVEARRFAAAVDTTAAKAQFDALALWAYEGALVEPGSHLLGEPCFDAWRDECQLRVFYDDPDEGPDATQPLRLGADFRITLPPDYGGRLELTTEDELEAHELSDVIVGGLEGSLDVELGSGTVEIRVAEDNPGVRCEQAELEACEAADWALDCGCLDLGWIDVESFGHPDVTIDLPADAWARVGLEVRDPPYDCPLIVECGDFDACEISEPNAAVRLARLNDPSDGASANDGMRVGVGFDGCADVTHEPWPECAEVIEPRGSARVCSGCLDGGQGGG